LELFHIKLIFISFSLSCNHFTSLAYEIFYAREVDLFDKIKEVVFSQLFPCVCYQCQFEPKKEKRIRYEKILLKMQKMSFPAWSEVGNLESKMQNDINQVDLSSAHKLKK
jgi:hypothetical protein